MLDWIREIFTDADGRASSKRLTAFILALASIFAVFLDKDPTQLVVLAGILMAATEARNIGTKREK